MLGGASLRIRLDCDRADYEVSDVIRIDEHRPRRDPGDVVCMVRFYANRFRDQDSRDVNLILSVRVEGGDFEKVIEAVRQEGGFWVKSERQAGAWFVPWPPAAIEVIPASQPSADS